MVCEGKVQRLLQQQQQQKQEQQSLSCSRRSIAIAAMQSTGWVDPETSLHDLRMSLSSLLMPRLHQWEASPMGWHGASQPCGAAPAHLAGPCLRLQVCLAWLR